MADFDIVTTGLRFPEGPIAMPDGAVILVEIAGGTLTKVDPRGSKTVIAHLGGGPNGAAIGPDGACYVCNNGGFIWHEDSVYGLRPIGPADGYQGGWIDRVDLATGEITRLYQAVGGNRLSAPNDIVFDRHGGFWFTDMGKTTGRSHAHGGIYYAKTDGSALHEVVFPFSMPNGIGLSADENRLYVAETGGARLWEFALSAPGKTAPLPYPAPGGAKMLYVSPRFQRLDSLALDSDGNICVAAVMDGMVLVIAPDGREIQALSFPDLFPTNICFGGTDLRTAYVTLSGTGRLISMPWPRAGLGLNFQNH